MFFKIIFYILHFVVGILFFSFLVFFLWNSYENIVLLILNYFDKIEKSNVFKTEYLTLRTFYIIRVLLIIINIGWLILTYFIKKYNKVIFDFFENVNSHIKREFVAFSSFFKSLKNDEKYVLVTWLIVFFVSRLYFIIKFPLHIDEAFSYVFLVSKGIGVTLTYYPGPNNHIAYLILCNLSDVIFNDPIWIMRFPALLISVSTSILILGLGKKYIEFYPTLIGLSFFSFSEFGIFYSTHGRGYYLLIFCVIVALISLVKVLQQHSINDNKNNSFIKVFKQKFYHSIFIASCSVGFFSIPIFLYPFISLLSIWIIFILYHKKYSSIRDIFYSSSLIGVLTLIFYTPVLIVSGLSSIVGNSWVKALDFYSFFTKYFDYLLNTHGTFYSIEKWGAIFSILFLVVSILALLNQKVNAKYKNMAIIGLCIVIIPLGIIIIQRVLPFSRVWIYKSLVEYLFLGIVFFYFFKKLKIRYQYKIVLISMSLLIHAFVLIKYWVDEINNPKNIYNQLPKLIAIIDDLKIKKSFVNHDVYNVFLRSHYLTEQKKIDVSVTIYKEDENYELLIFNKKKTLPEKSSIKKYIEFYQDDFVIAYKRE